MAEERKPLRPDQEALPYSKYYYNEPATPNPRLMEILRQGPMDPDKALPLEELNQILDPGYHEVETGYCQLPSGMGYVAVNNVFPGCTIEMMKWWFAWHAAGGNLRYMMWYPPGHHAIAVADQDRRKLMDPNAAIDDKITNISHFVVEDTGGGIEDIVIRFHSLPGMGFDMDKFKTSPTKAIVGGYGVSEPRSGVGPPKAPAVMLHTMRETGEGIEFRTRFYMGARIVGGKPRCTLPPGVRVPIEAPMGLAFHNVMEYSNLASFLPEVYAEYGKLAFTDIQ